MSNKPHNQLDTLDATLRRSAPVGMEEGVKEIVLRRAGFELFNTRPYHNYETWSDGYTIIGRRDGAAMDADELAHVIRDHTDTETYLFVYEEDLDDAIATFARLRAEAKEGDTTT